MPKTVVRDATSQSLPPIDTNVKIPDSVKRAAAAAEAYYAQPAAPAAPEPPEPPAAPEPPQPAPPAAPEPPEPPAAPAAPAAPEPPEPPPGEPVPPEQWEHRFRSMKGRYDAQLQINGQMQEQMGQLGDELVRTQQMLQRGIAASA